MNREEFIEAFAQLSAEEQEKLIAKLEKLPTKKARYEFLGITDPVEDEQEQKQEVQVEVKEKNPKDSNSIGDFFNLLYTFVVFYLGVKFFFKKIKIKNKTFIKIQSKIIYYIEKIDNLLIKILKLFLITVLFLLNAILIIGIILLAILTIANVLDTKIFYAILCIIVVAVLKFLAYKIISIYNILYSDTSTALEYSTRIAFICGIIGNAVNILFSGFSMIASIINFKILNAVGFFFLTLISYISYCISSYIYETKK